MSGKPKKTTSGEAKKGGSLPRSALYAAVSAHTMDAINTLVDLMHNSTNPNVKLGASKAIMDKSIPDLKAMELQGKDGDDLKLVITIIEDKHVKTDS